MLAMVLLASAAFAQAPAAPSEAAAPAQVWVVFPTRAVNLGGDDVVAADALFRLRMADAVGAPLVGQAETRAAMTAGTDDAALQKACAALSCARWATLDLIKLGDELYVTAMLRDEKGAQLYRVDVTSKGISQLDENLDRISRALVERIPYDKVPARKTYVPATSATPPGAPAVVGAEPEAPAAASPPPVVYVDRERANAVHGAHVGAWVPLGLGSSTGLSVAYDARWEHPGFFYEFDAGFVYPIGLDAFWGLYADLGWSKLLQAGGVRIYVGGGGGPRPYVAYGPNGGFGGGLYAQAGVTNAAKAKVRMYGQLRAGADVFNDLYYGGYYGAAYLGVEAGVGF